jgi:beta-lactamase superfamily II metal-dependent hydrolase
MEVYFLDVGQGTSQLILLGGQRAIVIDSGTSSDGPLLRALQHYHVERLVRLVITHNHNDHVGGASRVLTTYTGNIDQIWFLDDHQLHGTRFYRRLRQLVDDEELDSDLLIRIERGSQPRVLFEEGPVRLQILSPTFFENAAAIDADDANQTSAILLLDVWDTRIVFGADSWLGQWQKIRAEHGKPLECDILAVPHHGGNVGQANDGGDLEWLYSEAIQAEYAVISVGSNNRYEHPDEAVIRALRLSGATVICTQMTEKCCTKLEQVRHGMLSPLETIRDSVSQAEFAANTRRSRRVACAGTVVAEINAQGVRIRGIESHQAAIANLATCEHGRPMCVGQPTATNAESSSPAV